MASMMDKRRKNRGGTAAVGTVLAGSMLATGIATGSTANTASAFGFELGSWLRGAIVPVIGWLVRFIYAIFHFETLSAAEEKEKVIEEWEKWEEIRKEEREGVANMGIDLERVGLLLENVRTTGDLEEIQKILQELQGAAVEKGCDGDKFIRALGYLIGVVQKRVSDCISERRSNWVNVCGGEMTDKRTEALKLVKNLSGVVKYYEEGVKNNSVANLENEIGKVSSSFNVEGDGSASFTFGSSVTIKYNLEKYLSMEGTMLEILGDEGLTAERKYVMILETEKYLIWSDDSEKFGNEERLNECCLGAAPPVK